MSLLQKGQNDQTWKPGHIKMAVLSDDLTGACGVGSMIYPAKTVTVNVSNLDSLSLDDAEFLVLNMNVRHSKEEEIADLVEQIVDHVMPKYMALRIDSIVRGSTALQILTIAKLGKVLVTDTIPEYNRFTENGITKLGDASIDIIDYLRMNNAESILKSGDVVVEDSRTYEDLEKLAEKCWNEHYIPVDPGPLISKFSRVIR